MARWLVVLCVIGGCFVEGESGRPVFGEPDPEPPANTQPGPFVRVDIKPLLGTGGLPLENCLAKYATLIDSAGRVYTAPAEACDSYTVDLPDGESASTVQLVVEGRRHGYQVAVTPRFTL